MIAVAEANFYGDPHAANIIFNFAKNLTIIPLNVTQRAIISPKEFAQIDKFHKSTGDPLGLLISPLLSYYLKFYTQSVPGIKGSPLHDVLPVWYLFNKSEFDIQEIPIKMVVDEEMHSDKVWVTYGLSIQKAT
ncbi:hypothetical protein GCM10007199_39850 [Fictibacillus barbaricus]|nr:hypothetical protein GCM10007199_39850 [Fictibacillus barbaricus]